eukprot:4278606-Amphidinium_carterae.1
MQPVGLGGHTPASSSSHATVAASAFREIWAPASEVVRVFQGKHPSSNTKFALARPSMSQSITRTILIVRLLGKQPLSVFLPECIGTEGILPHLRVQVVLPSKETHAAHVPPQVERSDMETMPEFAFEVSPLNHHSAPLCYGPRLGLYRYRRPPNQDVNALHPEDLYRETFLTSCHT